MPKKINIKAKAKNKAKTELALFVTGKHRKVADKVVETYTADMLKDKEKISFH